jgi:DNA polymerase III alpha subunit
MKLNTLGQPIYQESDIFDLLYNRSQDLISKILVEPTNEVCKLYSQLEILPSEASLESKELFDNICQSNWYIPDEYKVFDIYQYCLTQCTSDIEKQRVLEELQLFEDKKLIPLLQTLKYIVDVFRDNNVVWGVGRGSSVSSYVLFLLGVHKIDSIKYGLDYKEFLR